MSKPLKVLIVEDSEDDAKLALRALRLGGFDPTHRRVQTAAELETALAQERWDAVISDFNMPGFTGMNALGIFRSTGLDIPFILISGTIGEVTAVDAMKAGASDYLMKTSLTRLAPALERELKETQMRAAHRQAQYDLVESERRLRTIIETQPECVKVVSREGVLLEMNAAGLAMLEADSLAAAQSRPLLDFIVPEYRAAFAALHERVMRGESGILEYELIGLKGGRRWLETHAAPMTGANGEVAMLLGITRDITGRKQAEAVRSQLAAIVESSNDAIISRTPDGTIVSWNAGAQRMFGYTAAEAVGQDIILIIPPGQQEEAIRNRALLAKGLPVPAYDTVRVAKDGRQIDVMLTHSQIRNESGAMVGISIIFRDIGERKKTEEARANLAAIVENSNDGIFSRTLEGAILSWNAGAERMLGYTATEAIGKPANFNLPPGRQPNMARNNEKVLRGEATPPHQSRRLTKDGRVIDVLTSHSPIRDSAGKIIAASVILHDISVLKRAEEVRAQLAAIVEFSQDAIVSVAPDRIILTWNAGAERIFGYTAAEALGRNVGFLIPGDLSQEADMRRLETHSGQTPRVFETERLAKDGRRIPVSLSTSPVRGSDGAVSSVALIFRDVSERKLQEQKLDKLARIRAVSSEINAVIIRIHDRDALLRETCRVAAEHGKFELVWIGLLDHDRQEVKPVAWTGFSLEAAHAVNWASISSTGGTLGKAILTRKAEVSNDIDAAQPASNLRREALQKGCPSTVCLPLVADDTVVALIALFAPGSGFFDDGELVLLNEVAADVSFALQGIKKQEALDYLSYYDPLTGLANRSLFLERVAQYMRSATDGSHKLAVFLIDLERFRNINDSLGRPAGDALLRHVAQWLTRNVGDASLLARVGADHFAVVLPEVRQEGNVARLLEKMMEAFLLHPFRLNDTVLRISAKVGIALFPDDGSEPDALFRNAEAALEKAKARGDRYLFYTQQMSEAVAGKLTLENQLRQALDNGEFVLHYQPKVNLASGKLTGGEALIRWNDPRTGLVTPGRFIPVLEETGLIHEAGRWALRKAIEDYLRWRVAGLPAVRIAVNVSALQLRNRGFIEEIRQAIGIDAHAAAGLELEITESVIMEDVKHSIAVLEAIRAMGVTITIDDFGTGFSSLSYLAKLPVDTLKIDRSFVTDMTAGPEGLALVSTIINLAHSLTRKVVAEGVETEEQSRLLRLLRCDEMQGFLFSKPVPGEVFEARFLALPAAA